MEKRPAENTPAEKSPADKTPILNNPPDNHPEAADPTGMALGNGGLSRPMSSKTINAPQMMK
jgi:hypothetical protein